MANTPNLTLWNVSQAHYEEDDMCISGSTLYNIASYPYQPIGEPIDQNIFFCQINEDRKSNPLSLTYWNFALAASNINSIPIPTIENIASCFSTITAKTTTSKLVGYSYGGQSSGTLTYMEPVPMGSTDPSTVLNNTFGKLQNLMRWYPSQTIQAYDDPFSNMYPFLRVNRKKICGVIYVDVSRGYDDCTSFETSGEAWYAWSYYTYTLEEWLASYQGVYPEILRAYIVWYIGDNNNRSLSDIGVFTDYNYFCDDLSMAWTCSTVPPDGDWSSEDMPKLNSDVIPHGYMFQTMIFEGFRCIHDTNRSVENIAGITRGIFQYGTVRRSIYKSGLNWVPAAVCWYAGTVAQLKEAARRFRLPIAKTVNKARYGDVETDPDIELPRSNPDGTYKDYTTDPDEKAEELANDFKQPDFDPTTIDPEYTEGDPEDPDDPAYDPVDDPEEGTKEIPMNNPQLGTVGIFNRCYAVHAEELEDLANYLWNVDPDIFDTILKGLELAGSDPLNAIISIFMYPFEVEYSGALEDIRIGTVDTEITGLAISHTSVKIYELGEVYFWEKFKNYLDYEPYTTAQLYVPYVGVMQLPVKVFMRKWVNVKLVVDLLTGVGQVVVYARTADSMLPILYRDCTIGTQIAVTGRDAAQIAGNYVNAITRIGSGIAGMAGAGAAGNVGGVLSASKGIAEGCYNLFTAENVPIESSGSSSPQCSLFMPQKCYLIVNRPNPIELDNYGHLIGYACWKSGLVGGFAGFSKFSNVVLDITVATEKEKKEILNQLASGVFV